MEIVSSRIIDVGLGVYSIIGVLSVPVFGFMAYERRAEKMHHATRIGETIFGAIDFLTYGMEGIMLGTVWPISAAYFGWKVWKGE